MKVLKYLGVVALVAVLVIIGVNRHNNDKAIYNYQYTTIHYVERGETLWGIAEDYSDDRHDVRRVKDEIQSLTGCNENLHPGQELIVPVYNVLSYQN